MGNRNSGMSMHGGDSMVGKVRSAGTSTASAAKWWLPVPHSPDTVHVSSISTSAGAKTTIRSRCCPSTCSTQLPNSQAECSQPLANAHRPLTRYPPSTGSAVPDGANAPPMMTSGPSA